ncbi:hypothetical protein P2W68_14465 [Chryseobacterium arthrosphaerae]|uniref:hypothetical protein n=1 Tax=Chryseobacterium arthrosphaerae TaxID=651561 RepID=UPI0023E2643C|nr:hypothetical protein [Chryseobacterium arthrosphaerae]WES96051.1 hypothetical protein P2W68_14465 [Chryseobacterium arthrosphaerae]
MILRLSVLAVFLTLLWSCRSDDFTKTEINPQRNNSAFFKLQSSLYAKNGTDYIRILEEYNKETDFLSQMPDEKGMPVWDKMYAVETETATGLMIPLSYDNETMSSVLFATLDGKNTVTGVRNYDNAVLQNIVYDQKISVENREKLFFTFMFMDNRTFGNEEFIGVPRDLFTEEKYDDQYGRIKVSDFTPISEVIVQQEGKLFIGLTCFTTYHCTHHGGGACDGCSECQTTTCNPVILGTADDPFPPNGGGGGGGGSGGGGTPPIGPNVPDNPCGGNMSSAFYRPGPGCGGGVIPGNNDPCQKTKKLINNAKTKPAIDALKAKSPLGGEDGYKIKADGTLSGVIHGAEHSVDFGDKTGYAGGYHNHTPTGIPIFSPNDMDQLLQFALAQGNYGNPKNAFIGMVAPNGMHYVIWFNGNYNDALVTFSQEQMDDYTDRYQTRYGMYKPSSGDMDNEAIEKFLFRALKDMGLDGKVNLQRIENDGTVKTIIKNTDGTITVQPCP